MPSLLPTTKEAVQPIDLAAVFSSDKNRRTVERAIKYLRPFYEHYSNRSFEEINSASVTEEFFLLMPTAEAFNDEIALVKAIEKHADGAMSDLEIKAVLDAFIQSHTFIYAGDMRVVKRGDFDVWAPDADLVYLSNADYGFVCNRVQAQLVKLLHADLEFRAVKI